MSRPENKNGQQGGQGRGVGKNHIVDPTIIRSMLEKERAGTLEITPSLKQPSPVITACHIKIVAACTGCDFTNTLSLQKACKIKSGRPPESFATQAMFAQ
jgi:hypothetical protein